MHISKNLAALVAAASLGGGALAFVAPATAFAAAPPAGADVVGTVTVNGAAAANAEVDLLGVNADGTYDDLGTAYTDAGGQYFFDFDADVDGDGVADGDASDGTSDSYDSRVGFINDTAPTQTQFKVLFTDDRTPVRGQLGWLFQYNGDQPTVKRAAPINRVLGGVTTVPTAALAVDSGAQGTVSVPVPAGYTYSGSVVAFDSDEDFAGQADFNSDPTDDATDPLDGQVSWEMRDLYPGGDYTFEYFASAVPTAGVTPSAPEIDYIGSFYGDSTTFAGATVVPIKSGQFATGINGSLTNVLQAKVKPSIHGQVAPGKTVSADPGTWNLTAQTRYSYQWLLNGSLVSTSNTYKVPAKHTVGKKLQLVVTNQVGDLSGTVAIAPTKVKYASKVKAKAHAVYVHGKRVVQIKGHVKVSGVKKKKLAKALKGAKVTVYEVSKTDDTVMVKVGKAKVKGGNLIVTVKGLISGKHFLEIDLSGKKIADATKTVKVKV